MIFCKSALKKNLIVKSALQIKLAWPDLTDLIKSSKSGQENLDLIIITLCMSECESGLLLLLWKIKKKKIITWNKR